MSKKKSEEYNVPRPDAECTICGKKGKLSIELQSYEAIRHHNILFSGSGIMLCYWCECRVIGFIRELKSKYEKGAL